MDIESEGGSSNELEDEKDREKALEEVPSPPKQRNIKRPQASHVP